MSTVRGGERIQNLVFESVLWPATDRFEARLEIKCNPYEGGDCTEANYERVLQSYKAVVKVPSLEISYQ